MASYSTKLQSVHHITTSWPYIHREESIGIDDSAKDVQLLNTESLEIGAGEYDASLLFLFDSLYEVNGGGGGSANGGGDGGGRGDHGIGFGFAIGGRVSDVADGLGGARVRVLEGGG